jgi:hypothetical protein
MGDLHGERLNIECRWQRTILMLDILHTDLDGSCQRLRWIVGHSYLLGNFRYVDHNLSSSILKGPG